MRISELGLAAGVNVNTIRYYERAGITPPPTRLANGYRSYGPLQLACLIFICRCRALDLSLAEIKSLLDFMAQPQNDCAHIDHIIDSQLARVRARLASLHALEVQLATLRGFCHATTHAHDCANLKELVGSAQRSDARIFRPESHTNHLL